MRSLGPADRDAALLRLRRARTWIALGAVGLTGAASAAAAASFRGHHATRTTATTASPETTAHAPRPAPSGPDAIPLPPSASGDQGLQAPQQPPQQAPAQQAPAQPDPQPPSTSGGS
jgi:hypothetical protein